VLDDRSDESEPATVDGPDHLLSPTVVADGATHLLHSRRQRRDRHEAGTPDLVEQFLASHQPVTMPDEVHQQVEGLRLEGDLRAVEAQLVPLRVERARAEGVHHSVTSPRFRSITRRPGRQSTPMRRDVRVSAVRVTRASSPGAIGSLPRVERNSEPRSRPVRGGR
jgi:hypothetical protein